MQYNAVPLGHRLMVKYSVAVSRVLGESLADSSRRLAFLGRLIRLAVKLPNSE